MSELGQVAVITDCEHKTAAASDLRHRYAWSVGTKAIRNGRIDYSQARPVDESTYRAFSARRTPRAGDLILAREAPVGDSVLVPAEPVCLGQRTVLISPDKQALDHRYLYYVLRGPRAQEWMRLHSEGSTVKHLNVRDIYRIPLGPLPPLAEQERIAGVLGAFDDLIEVNRRLVADLEGAVLALFAAAGFDAPPSDGAGSRLGDLIMINPTLTKPKGEAPYIDMAALPTENAFIGSHTTRPAQGGARFQNGDTLLARITPCLENGKTGVVTSLGPEEVGVGSTEFIVLRGVVHTAGVWSYCMARSPRFRTFAVQQLSDGSTGRQRLSAEAVANYRVRTPDPNALESFKAGSSPLFAAAAQLSTEIADLTRQRDELLPLLMSGKVVGAEGVPLP